MEIGIQKEAKNWDKPKKVAHVLEKLKELNNIPCINYGGCAMAAYGIVEYSKQLNIEAKVVYLFDDMAQRDYTKLKNNQGNGSCSHAVVEIANGLYDTNGEFDRERHNFSSIELKRLELSQEQVKESIAYRRHWNPRFKRRQGKKLIQQTLGIPLKIKIKEA